MYRDRVGAGHLDDLLERLRYMSDDINMLDDLLGHVDVLDDLYLNWSINMLDDVYCLVNYLCLVYGVGAVNINHLDLRDVTDLLDLDDLGHVPNHLYRSIDVLRDWDVAYLLDDLGLDLRHVAYHFKLSLLGDYLGYVTDDLLNLWHLYVLDGYVDVHGHRGLHVLDLRHRDVHGTLYRHSLNKGYFDLLLDELRHVYRSVHYHLARNMADLRDLYLHRAGYLAVLDDLIRHVLVDDLVLRNFNHLLYGNRACDMLGNLDLLDNSLDLHLRNFNHALHWSLNILHLRDLHYALLCYYLRHMDDTLLSENLALNQVYGSRKRG